MSRTMLFIAMISFLGCLTTPSMAQDSRWGSPDDPLVKFVIAIEAKWASSSCSPQPDLKAVIADDFQGTATNGHATTRQKPSLLIPRLSSATVSSVMVRCGSSETPLPLPTDRKAASARQKTARRQGDVRCGRTRG
jgi:hypothetical protein